MKKIIIITILTAIIFGFDNEFFNITGFQFNGDDAVECDYTMLVDLQNFYFDISARGDDKTIIYKGDYSSNLIYVLEKFTNWTDIAKSNKITNSVNKLIERQRVDGTFKFGNKYKTGVMTVRYQFFVPSVKTGEEMTPFLVIRSDEIVASDNEFMTSSEDVVYFTIGEVNKLLDILYNLKESRLKIVQKEMDKQKAENIFK